MQLNKYKEAVNDYDTALKLDPNFTKAYSKRGQCHSKLENFEEAVRDHKQAADQDKANRGILPFESAVTFCAEIFHFPHFPTT